MTLGRTTDSKGDVDIDLTGEEQQQQQQMAAPTGGVGGEPGEQGGGTGAAGSQVSRRQALIRLGADGVFRLTNMGRQVVLVNGVEVGNVGNRMWVGGAGPEGDGGGEEGSYELACCTARLPCPCHAPFIALVAPRVLAKRQSLG